MAILLTHEEIDSLLTAISSKGAHVKLTIEEFENRLINKTFREADLYGIDNSNISVNRFFKDKHSENILSDIKDKNSRLKMGNVKIPGTNIELINYSICPCCQTIFSYRDLMEYYSNPKVNKAIHRAAQTVIYILSHRLLLSMEFLKMKCNFCAGFRLLTLLKGIIKKISIKTY